MSLPSLRPITHHRTMHFPHGFPNVTGMQRVRPRVFCPSLPFPPSPSNPISYSSIECVINQTTVASSVVGSSERTTLYFPACSAVSSRTPKGKGGCDLRGYEWGSLLKHSPSSLFPSPSLSTAQFFEAAYRSPARARCPIHSPLSQQTQVFSFYLAR